MAPASNPPQRPRAPLPAAVYLLLAVAWAWPLPLHLGNRFAYDAGDPLLVTYLLWWNAHVVPLSSAMWNAPFYWPLRDALALTEHGAGMSLLTSPIQWFGGSPLLAYNVLLIATVWLAGLSMHALVRRLTGSTAAAFCGGLAFAFSPYRASQLSHLHLLVTWWMPLALLGLHAFYEDGRRRWLALFGVSWLLQSLTNGYYMFFLPVLLLAWIAWFTPWRSAARKAADVLAAWMLFSLPLLPVLYEYYSVQRRLGLFRTRTEMQMYSAHLASFYTTAPLLRFWHGRQATTDEDFLFPGVAAIAVIVIALLVARRQLAGARARALAFYAAATLLMTWMTFGPAAEPWSIASVWHAYDWIGWLPGYSGLRVPERFFMLSTLCLATTAGLGMSALAERFRRQGQVVAAIAALLIVADGWIVAMQMGTPPRPFGITLAKDGRVLELPMTDAGINVAAIYRGMLHGLPVVNGYAGYIPPHAGVLEWALRRKDPSVLTELRRGHPLYVAVANGPDAPEWTAFMDAQNDARMLGVSGAGRLYEMPPSSFARTVSIGAGLSPVRVTTDAGWLVAELPSPLAVRAVDLRTRGHVVWLQQTVRVDTSPDGVAWTVAAEEPSGGLAFVGVLAEPRLVPLRIIVPDARAKFVRINGAPFGIGAITLYGSP